MGKTNHDMIGISTIVEGVKFDSELNTESSFCSCRENIHEIFSE